MPHGLLPASGLSGVLPPLDKCASPSWFRAAEGVRSAWPCGESPFGRTPSRGGSAAQKAGIRYERKALSALSKALPDVEQSKWFKFSDATKAFRFCQVDALLHTEALTVIFEVKTRFTSDAWFQLRQLYEPVVRKALYPKSFALVIICKHFDPAAPFPEPVQHINEGTLRELQTLSAIGVLSWKL